MAPGTSSMIALSTISMTAMLKVSVASAIGTTAASASPAQQRQAGERVTEEERERDGEGDRAPVGEAERGADDHAGDLAERAAGEAVQRGAERNRVELATGRRELVVVMVIRRLARHAADGHTAGWSPTSCRVAGPDRIPRGRRDERRPTVTNFAEELRSAAAEAGDR